MAHRDLIVLTKYYQPVVDFVAIRAAWPPVRWWVVARHSADRLGLIDLDGIIVPRRHPAAAAQGTLNADGEELGEPGVRENRVHGSMGAGGNQESVGHAVRHRAPLANPTDPSGCG